MTDIYFFRLFYLVKDGNQLDLFEIFDNKKLTKITLLFIVMGTVSLFYTQRRAQGRRDFYPNTWVKRLTVESPIKFQKTHSSRRPLQRLVKQIFILVVFLFFPF